jgi:hypothetical protein
MKEQIDLLVKTFFDKLGASIDSIGIIQEEDDIYLVKIKSDDSGMLIGPH